MALTNGILTAPFTKIALNGQGDLQKALGRTTCYSEIQLIGDVDANSNRVGAINKWAKFKPFQYSGIFTDSGPGSSRETAMRAALLPRSSERPSAAIYTSQRI